MLCDTFCVSNGSIFVPVGFMGLPGPRPVPGPMGPNGEPGLQLGAISPGEITRDPPKQVGLRNEFPETWLWKLYVIGYVEFHLNIW